MRGRWSEEEHGLQFESVLAGGPHAQKSAPEQKLNGPLKVFNLQTSQCLTSLRTGRR